MPKPPHPFATLKTELIWEGKYDAHGNRRAPVVGDLAWPLHTVECINSANPPDDFRNQLIAGDNLPILASLLSKFEGKFDLIYLDPPFDVGAEFNLDVPEKYDATTGKSASTLAFRDAWGKGADSYLQMMYERLALMKPLLSEHGTIYVHCDWRTSGAMRLLLDDVFGTANFRNEIIWLSGVGDTSAKNRKFIKSHDTIFSYSKSDKPVWNDSYQDYSPASDKLYNKRDEHGIYRLAPVDNPSGGGYRYSLNAGETMPRNGYRMPHETAVDWLQQGILVVEKDRVPSRKLYRNARGVRCKDVWTDISGSVDKCYCTEKPEALLRRIVLASSNEGSLIGDFFCGSGTTGAVAERLNRRWIMTDSSGTAINAARKRMISAQRKLLEKGKSTRAFDMCNLGMRERLNWLREKLQGSAGAYRQTILKFFGAECLANSPSPLLHGRMDDIVCYVDDIDGTFTSSKANALVTALVGTSYREAYCLFWNYEVNLPDTCLMLRDKFGIRLRLLQIPDSVIKPSRRTPPVFETISKIGAEVIQRSEIGPSTIDIKLNYYLTSGNVLGDDEINLIDFWAVDFDWHRDLPFKHHWCAFRTRKNNLIDTCTTTAFTYPEAGNYTACVKVIDMYGAEARIALEIKVGDNESMS